MMSLTKRVVWLFVAALSLAAPRTLLAQAPAADASPSFSLAASRAFNTRERPSITLIHRGVDRLDFRVYKVNDAFAFFEKLRDPHTLGSEAPIVPQERTLLERIALWKAEWRSEVRGFVRRQFSPTYRRVQREKNDKAQVVQRQAINVNSFAQVPLLNRAQLVTSWRELLPRVRDAEFRRVPLDVTSAGIYVVEAVNGPLKAYTVVVISDVGLVTKTSPGQLFVFAANRFSGAPLGACAVRVMADQKTIGSGTTGSDGTLALDLAVARPDNLVTIAQCGGQTAATDPGAYSVHEPTRELAGFVYTDRPVYRPGHLVRFKGVLRWRERSGLTMLGRDPVEVSVIDGNDKVLLRDRKPVDEFGAVTGTFTVPATGSLGNYTVRVASGEATAMGSFEVQEYRKPEFDVSVVPASRFMLQGGSVKATITSRYYFGQPVNGASVKYVVHVQPYYSPLRYDDSGGGDEGEGGGDEYGYGGDQEIEGTARLNEQGTAEISVPLEVDEHGRDYTARIEARVTDASDREVAGAASVNATYGRFLLAVDTNRYVFSPGDTAALRIRAIDYAGAPQAGASLRIALEQFGPYTNGERVVTIVRETTAATDAEGRAQASIQIPNQPGSYQVRVSSPSEGRQVSDTAFLWVPGRSTASVVDDSDQMLELVADKKSYQPGETARLIIRGAEFEAPVLVTKEVRAVSFHQVVTTRANEAISVPIDEGDVGDTYVSIAFLKDDRLYRAERRLTVPATAHQLTITATPDKPVLRPGEPGVFSLQVVDAAGAPVRAQLSVGLVDEALYGVRQDTTPNPLRFFYRREYSLINTSFSRDYPFVGYSGTDQLLLARRHGPMTLADFKTERPDRPRVRKDFPDTAFWAGDVTTAADGTAKVKVDYPDSLTSWRLTVRGVTVATAVGVTTAHTTTTKDVILRVVTPRFLTEGDHVTIPAIVHSYLPDAKAASVSIAAEGLTADGGEPAGPRAVQVAPNGQGRTDWKFTATQVRSVSLTGRATTDTAGDAMQLSLPVLPAGLQRNVGSSGSLVGAGERSVALTVPPTANASARTIRVALSPSLAGTMLGALDYLTSYPWGCTEQTLSSFVPNLVVLRALSQMKIAPVERLQALDRQVDDGLKRLYDYQHDDGGWGWWKTDQNHPFMTAYALDGLLKARASGVKFEEWRIGSARRALEQLYAKYPRAMPDLKAYEVYVLARASTGADSNANPGEPEPFNLNTAIDDVWAARARMTPSGRALLLMTLDQRKDSRGDTAARELIDAAQTRGDISWWQADSDPMLDDFADTSVEASGLALKALAPRDPNNALLERAARWLVLNRSAGGYWVSTKQTALALEGLLAYMNARGETPAPFTADIFVNGARVATHAFTAQSLTAPDPVMVEAPASTGENTVRIVKQGGGALYYDASARYYDKPAAAAQTGTRKLALLRSYFTLSPVTVNGRIVYRETPFAGNARAGDLILVRVNVAGSTDWRYLMLEDPIPAGAEAVERESVYRLEKRQQWWYGSQRELRDDRVVFFLSDFAAGRYEFTYMLKVTTPGTFSAMPARISPMYVPNVSASSDTLTMVVSDEAAK